MQLSSVPLTQAVTSGDADAVSTVLANGADVNERTGGGQTALILATIFGHTHLIPLLLDAGADPLLRDNLGLNAVDWAQRRGATEVIDVLAGKPVQTPTIFATKAPPPAIPETTRPPQPTRSLNLETEQPRSVSEEERSRRWITGLKQRIAEQSHTEIPEGPNIFRPQRELIAEAQRRFLESGREPQPEIPALPQEPQPDSPAPAVPQPEIPALPPDPEPDLPSLPPEPELPGETPKPELPGKPPQPELPGEPPVQEPVMASGITAEKTPPRPSNRKRCPQCNAIYNSDLIAYCVHHVVPLVDADAPPIISEPQKTSHTMFWVLIAITLTGSIIAGSLFTSYFYTSETPTQQAAAPPAPVPVQKGRPRLDGELEGKAVSLPIAESPLKGQEAIPGVVSVRVVIDKSGKVKEAQASGGDWLLRGAASEAALKSTFAPEKLRGRETEGRIIYTFDP